MKLCNWLSADSRATISSDFSQTKFAWCVSRLRRDRQRVTDHKIWFRVNSHLVEFAFFSFSFSFFLWYGFLRGNFIFTVLAGVREQATIGSSFARHLLANVFLFRAYHAYTVYETFWNFVSIIARLDSIVRYIGEIYEQRLAIARSISVHFLWYFTQLSLCVRAKLLIRLNGKVSVWENARK